MDFTVNSNAIKSISTADYPAFIPHLPLTKIRLDFTNNSNAIGNYNLARLYMERTQSDKQEQQVTFTNTGETIMYPRQVDLKATATSGGKIYYRIIKGRDAADLKGNVLTFKDGQSTEVVVEATQYGNETVCLRCKSVVLCGSHGREYLYLFCITGVRKQSGNGIFICQSSGKSAFTTDAEYL